MDGASKGNPSLVGGGTILHDHSGHIIFAVSHFYDIQTNIVAKAMAIRGWHGAYIKFTLHLEYF